MNWKFWKKKEEEPAEEEVVPRSNPKLVLELTEDYAINVGCVWPAPDSGEEAGRMIAGYANMLFLLATGKLLPTIKSVVGGVNHDKLSAQMAKAIILALNNALKAHGFVESNEPMINPQTAFLVRGPHHD